MDIELKILNQDFIEKFGLPSRATPGSAAFDLRADIPGPIELGLKQTRLIHTGFAIYINDPNYAALIIPRSGLGNKYGITLGNTTGLIDSDYQGEILVSLYNRKQDKFLIEPGDRIAQLFIVPVLQANFKVVEEFSLPTARGTGGIGHTGVK